MTQGYAKETQPHCVSHLMEHYDAVTTTLKQKKELLSNRMATVQTQATHQEVTSHEEKTDERMSKKLSDQLAKRKKTRHHHST